MITLLIAFLYFIASEVKYSCRYCAKKFHNITALRRHTQDIHIKKDLSYPSVCIDVQRGVFMVAVAQSGPIAPVHIQKHTQKQLLYCEDKDCQDIMKATKDINPSVECKHLQAVIILFYVGFTLVECPAKRSFHCIVIRRLLFAHASLVLHPGKQQLVG